MRNQTLKNTSLVLLVALVISCKKSTHPDNPAVPEKPKHSPFIQGQDAPSNLLVPKANGIQARMIVGSRPTPNKDWMCVYDVGGKNLGTQGTPTEKNIGVETVDKLTPYAVKENSVARAISNGGGPDVRSGTLTAQATALTGFMSTVGAFMFFMQNWASNDWMQRHKKMTATLATIPSAIMTILTYKSTTGALRREESTFNLTTFRKASAGAPLPGDLFNRIAATIKSTHGNGIKCPDVEKGATFDSFMKAETVAVTILQK